MTPVAFEFDEDGTPTCPKHQSTPMKLADSGLSYECRIAECAWKTYRPDIDDDSSKEKMMRAQHMGSAYRKAKAYIELAREQLERARECITAPDGSEVDTRIGAFDGPTVMMMTRLGDISQNWLDSIGRMAEELSLEYGGYDGE